MFANRTWRLPHFRKWPSTEATVESCKWVLGHDNVGGTAGHFDISFHYKVNSQLYHGSFCCAGNEHVAPYRPSELLTVEYHPKKPARYYFAGAAPSYETLEAILVMAIFGLIVGYILIKF